jgi:hypothetical protein
VARDLLRASGYECGSKASLVGKEA